METVDDGHPGAGRILVLVVIGVAVVVVLYLAFGMPGMDHSSPGPDAEHDQMTGM
jgi:hypothetical protein